MKNRLGVLSAILAAGFVLTSVMPSTAYAYEGCHQRIVRAERRLDRAIRRHGPNSPQAQRRREQLEAVRAHCR